MAKRHERGLLAVADRNAWGVGEASSTAPSRSRLVKTSERGGNVSIASIAKGAVGT